MWFRCLRSMFGVPKLSKRNADRRPGLIFEVLEDRITPSNIIIDANPVAVTVNAGHEAMFTAAATGTPNPSVEWQVSTNGTTYVNTGATSPTLSFVAQSNENGDFFRALFTNSTGSLATTAAALTVDFAPVITEQPANQAVIVSSSVTLNTAGTANPAPSAQWYSSTDGVHFSLIPSATSSSYSFTAPASAGWEDFRVIYSNSVGSKTSATAKVTFDVPPSVTTNPSNQIVDAGQLATFTATATGTPTPSVEWQVSTDNGTTWVNTGATGPTLSFDAQMSHNGDLFRAVFTNPVGSQTTTAASLMVDIAPVITEQPVNQTAAVNSVVTLNSAGTANPAPLGLWYSSTDGIHFTLIPHAAGYSYSFMAPANAGWKDYRVIYSNSLGTVTSATAKVTFDVPPSVTTSPSNQNVAAGHLVTFTAAATGTPTPSVEWQVSTNGTTYVNTGATGPTLSFVAQHDENGDLFRAVFTDPVGSQSTTAATLTVT